MGRRQLCYVLTQSVPGTNQYWATRVKFMKNNMDINRVRNPALLLKLWLRVIHPNRGHAVQKHTSKNNFVFVMIKKTLKLTVWSCCISQMNSWYWNHIMRCLTT